MRLHIFTRPVCLVAITALLAGVRLATPRADEGMWTFDHPPAAAIQQRYGFTVTTEWLDHLRLSSVRFNDGGSGSFVSPDGLVLTNHHVALGQLQKLSTPQKNYVADGFNIPLTQLVLSFIILLGYLLPWGVLAYFLIKWREKETDEFTRRAIVLALAHLEASPLPPPNGEHWRA